MSHCRRLHKRPLHLAWRLWQTINGVMHCLTFLSQHIVLTLRHLPAEGGPHSIMTSNQIALIHLFPHSVSNKSQLFPSCLPQYKHARSFTRPPSPTTGAGGFTNPTSQGRIHSEGGGRWRVCVCADRVWRQCASMPRAQTVIMVCCMSNI